jgi:hypothetical protein
LVYLQTQGFLSESFGAKIKASLDVGATVIEHNIFGLASRWRPEHDNFHHLVPSIDTGYRFAVKQKVRDPRSSPHFYVLNKTTGPREAPTPGKAPPPKKVNSFLRIGRPDKVKWSEFEVRFVVALAKASPTEDFQLTLVGYPFDAPEIGIENLTVHVLPYLREIGKLLVSHEFYIHDSNIGETFGNSIAEAAAAEQRIIATVSLFRDSGHLDIVNAENSVLGTKLGLLKQPRAAVAAARSLRTLGYSQLPIAVFMARLIAIASGNYSPIHANFKDVYQHFSALRGQSRFGYLPPALLGIFWEGCRAIRRWAAHD